MVLLEPVTAMQNSMFRLARHVFTMWSLLLAMIAIFTIVSCMEKKNRTYSLLILTLVVSLNALHRCNKLQTVTMLWEVHFQLVLDP